MSESVSSGAVPAGDPPLTLRDLAQADVSDLRVVREDVALVVALGSHDVDRPVGPPRPTQRLRSAGRLAEALRIPLDREAVAPKAAALRDHRALEGLAITQFELRDGWIGFAIGDEANYLANADLYSAPIRR